jgi:hypothetical protein
MQSLQTGRLGRQHGRPRATPADPGARDPGARGRRRRSAAGEADFRAPPAKRAGKAACGTAHSLKDEEQRQGRAKLGPSRVPLALAARGLPWASGPTHLKTHQWPAAEPNE